MLCSQLMRSQKNVMLNFLMGIFKINILQPVHLSLNQLVGNTSGDETQNYLKLESDSLWHFSCSITTFKSSQEACVTGSLYPLILISFLHRCDFRTLSP